MKLKIEVGDLIGKPNKQKAILDSLDVESFGIGSVGSEADSSTQFVQCKDDLHYDLILESSSGSIVVKGTLKAKWVGQCRRCLKSVEGNSEFEISECFQREFKEGETYPLVDSEIDIAPMLHEAVILVLPLAPLCSSDCKGAMPEIFMERETGTDSRWEELNTFQEK